MKKQSVISTVGDNGKLTRNRELIANVISSFKGKEIRVTIEKLVRKRTNSQNAYLWGCVYPILRNCFYEHWGEHLTSEEVHEFCKSKFNPVEQVNDKTGEVISYGKSTTENDTVQQEIYSEKIRAFALDWFNTVIPLPNEQIEIGI